MDFILSKIRNFHLSVSPRDETSSVIGGDKIVELTARKNSSNSSAFSSDNLKETNKFNINNLDTTFNQENFNFTDFEDKYLVRNPVNDTTIAGYSSDEETFAECNSYIAPESRANPPLETSIKLNETEQIVKKNAKLSLTNLNFENLKIYDQEEDIDKTTTEIDDEVLKSEEEEEDANNVDYNELNETFKTMPEKIIIPGEFNKIGNSTQIIANSDINFECDVSPEGKQFASNKSIMGKQMFDKDSGIFLESIVQDSLTVEFKVPDVPPVASTIAINQRWCPPNILNPCDDGMISGDEFNFDAGAFDIFDKKSELGNIPKREDSLLLRFDPLLNRPVPVVLDVANIKPIVEEEQIEEEEENIVYSVTSLQGRLLDLSVQDDLEENQSPSSASANESQDKLCDSDQVPEHQEINDTLRQLEVRSPPTFDQEIIVLDDSLTDELEPVQLTKESVTNRRRSENSIVCIAEELQEDHETMSAQIINDINTEKEDDPVIETINSSPNTKEEYKMAEIEKKLKNQGIKSEDNDRKLKEFETREEALIKRLTEKEKIIAKMNSVIEAYETTISEFISEKAQIAQAYEKKCVNLQESSQLNAAHLLSLEDTFSDLHTKYERSKQMAIKFKQNEDQLVAEKKQLNELLATQEARYEKMKSHAMSQLQVANDKLENLSKNHAQEVGKLKALLKKEEIARTALAEQAQQKIRENEELVKICEELIGGGNVATENS